MGFSGKFYILHCPSKVYLTSLMGKWMRVVEVSTFQLLLMNLTKLCTNFISTPQRTLPPSLPVFFLIKLIKANPFHFLCFTFPLRCVTQFLPLQLLPINMSHCITEKNTTSQIVQMEKSQGLTTTKIPSEMGVAPPYKLFTLFSLLATKISHFTPTPPLFTKY